MGQRTISMAIFNSYGSELPIFADPPGHRTGVPVRHVPGLCGATSNEIQP